MSKWLHQVFFVRESSTAFRVPRQRNWYSLEVELQKIKAFPLRCACPLRSQSVGSWPGALLASQEERGGGHWWLGCLPVETRGCDYLRGEKRGGGSWGDNTRQPGEPAVRAECLENQFQTIFHVTNNYQPSRHLTPASVFLLPSEHRFYQGLENCYYCNKTSPRFVHISDC